MSFLPDSESVFLTEFLADIYEFNPSSFISSSLTANLPVLLSRLSPQSSLGADYENLYVPALPCLDILSLIPPVPGTALIKSADGQQKAMPSGRRSCILKAGENYLRLKGCGNLDKGFNVEAMEYPPEGKEIRGCCFEHTVIREQYMTYLINQALQPHGFYTGNVPLRYWKYQYPDLPLIDKYCGVFRTLGEKRLGSHIIAGINGLVQRISRFVNSEYLLSLFHSSRIGNTGITPTVKVLRQIGPLNQSIETWTADGVYNDNQILCNLLESDAEFMCVEDTLYEDPEIHLGNTSVRETLRKLSRLAWRIGWEVGTVKRIMQDSRISWGYFIDHNPFEPHCNAHCNNLVILSEEHENLVAPVDFDMAYRGEEFISTVQSEYFGQNDVELFENWLNCERSSLEYTLAGQENMANFKYGEVQEDSPLQVAIRDMLVLAFRLSFERKENNFKFERSSFEDIIRSCLLITRDIIEY